MTGCRARAATLAWLAMYAVPAAAAAQGGAPVPLIPSGPPPASAPAAPAPGAPGTAVEVGRLEAFDPAAVGVLQDGTGGFPLDLWQGTSRALVTALLPRLPATVSPAAQHLGRQLLLSAARVPAGADTGPGLLALRIERLLAIGDLDGAAALSALATSRQQDPRLRRAMADTHWLAGNTAAACDQTRLGLRDDGDVAWSKADAVCQALAGDPVAAGISAGLLRERQVEDAAFFSLLAALTAETPARLEHLEQPTPLHLAMARATKSPLPADSLRQASPAMLAALARQQELPPDVRLPAAERAAAYGALPPAELGRIYAAVAFSPDDLARAPTLAQQLPESRGNALLYQAVQVQTVPAAQAEALRVAWRRLVGAGASPATVARLYQPVFAGIEPMPSLAWFAAIAGRAALLTGDVGRARRWADLARFAGPADDGGPSLPLAPLLVLADPSLSAEAAVLDGWAAANQASAAQPEVQARRAERLFLLLDAIGQAVPDRLWLPAYEAAPAAPEGPPAAIRHGLAAAAAADRLGETVLFALLNLGEGGPAAADPGVAGSVVRALRMAGLESDARQVAVEAAVGSGL